MRWKTITCKDDNLFKPIGPHHKEISDSLFLQDPPEISELAFVSPCAIHVPEVLFAYDLHFSNEKMCRLRG